MSIKPNLSSLKSVSYKRDALDIIALTDSEGNIVEEITYDNAYGKVNTHSIKEENLTLNPYGYTGREMDASDLYYYRARYYDPQTQRFLGKDPIEFQSGDFNHYRYVGNNPLNYNDPSGLFIAQAIGGVIGAGAEAYIQYRSGTLGFNWTSVGKIVMAGGTGALGGFGANLAKAVAFGAGASGLNTLGQQAIDPCQDFDMKKVGESMLFGGAGGGFGRGLAAAGEAIKDTSRATSTITNVKYPTTRTDGPVGNYANAGTATGAVGGGAVANNGVFNAGNEGNSSMDGNGTFETNAEIDLGVIEVNANDVCSAPCQ